MVQQVLVRYGQILSDLRVGGALQGLDLVAELGQALLKIGVD